MNRKSCRVPTDGPHHNCLVDSSNNFGFSWRPLEPLELCTTGRLDHLLHTERLHRCQGLRSLAVWAALTACVHSRALEPRELFHCWYGSLDESMGFPTDSTDHLSTNKPDPGTIARTTVACTDYGSAHHFIHHLATPKPSESIFSSVKKENLTSAADESQPPPVWRRREGFHVLLRSSGRENSGNFHHLSGGHVVRIKERTPTCDDRLRDRMERRGRKKK